MSLLQHLAPRRETYSAAELDLPVGFVCEVFSQWSLVRDERVFTIFMAHGNEHAERTDVTIDTARAAVIACRDEIMARAVAHLV